MKPGDIWDPDTKIAHSGIALCYFFHREKCSFSSHFWGTRDSEEEEEVTLHLKRCRYKTDSLGENNTSFKWLFAEQVLCKITYGMKKSWAQKTVCHSKIKSPEAVKSGIAVKITFTWEGRLGTLQLLILFKDNACTTARNTEPTITPANLHQNPNLKCYQRLKAALSFNCINYQGSMQSSVNGSCLSAQHWV